MPFRSSIPRARHAGSSLLAAGVALLAVAGCGDGPADAPRTQLRDSAGIRIVEGRVDDLPVVQVAGPPLVSAGGDDPSTVLFRVRSLDRRTDGGWVLANGGSGELFYLGADGALEEVVGRTGDGPGEFADLSGVVALPGDSVLAWDRRQARGTVFGPDGELGRVFTPGASEVAGGTVVGRLEPEGWLVLAGASRFGGGQGMPDQGVVRPDLVHRLLATEGDSVRTLGSLPGAEMFLNIESSGGNITAISVSSFPYSRESSIAAGGDRVVMAVTERAEFTLRDATGTVTEIWRLGLPSRPVGDAEWDAAVDARVEEVEDPNAARELRGFLQEIDRPSSIPLWDDLHLDDTGRLWVRRYRAPFEETPNLWWRLDADGTPLQEVHLPEDFTVLWADGAQVAGIRTDDLGVETFEVYALPDPV